MEPLLADADQEQRLQYLNLLAMSLIEPDEIWWYWEQDRGRKVVGG
ncbi:PBECR2 nuclease fold domain-containing protein, partial [Methylomonas koyamae]